MCRSICLFALLLLAGPTVAESPVAAGYQEAIFSVADADKWVSTFRDVGGWEVIHDGDVDPALLDAWELPDSAAAREVVIGNPGTERGFIRLLQFSGVQQVFMRGNAQVWDTGGWFDVNVRAVDLDEVQRELMARDWQATSDTIEFNFGPFIVREWITRGPDGIVLAAIERVEPPLEGWPHLRKLSRAFNATQIVPDIEAARDFYRNKLGFKTYLDYDQASKEAGPNVLGIPHNLADKIVRNISIIHPDGTNEGSIEILAFDGLEGANHAPKAVPPNLGVLSLRFPVVDVEAFHAFALQQELDIVVEPVVVRTPPYGDWQLLTIRGPGGAWLEFYEQLETGEGR